MQLDLFSTPARERQLEVAIDELAERFGTNVVHAPTISTIHVRWRPLISWRPHTRLVLGHVRYGSLADITARSNNVRFTPNSGHLSARGGISARCQKQTLAIECLGSA